MKKLLFFAVAICLLSACGNNPKRNSNNSGANSVEAATRSENTPSYKLDDLLKSAEGNIGKQVTVVGYITHTCKHSGKRCFIVGDSQKTSMRVEAKGDIGGFNRELIGSQVAITGTMRENRLSQEYLDQMEKDVNAKASQEPAAGEVCDAELANIAEMKAWMRENGKDYYSVYYMDGQTYDIVEE